MSEGKTKQRIIGYDLARVMSILAVIAIHCFAFVVVGSFSPRSETWVVGNLVDTFSRWCVPVFIMLSGALLIRSDFDMAKLKDFYLHRVSKIFIPFLFWVVVYMIWYAMFQSDRPWLTDLHKGVDMFLSGRPLGGHLYFIWIIVGLYAITPFICLLVSKLSYKAVVGLASGALLASSVSFSTSAWITHSAGHTMVSMFVPYIGYYILGYVMSVQLEKIKGYISGKRLAMMFVATGLFIGVATYLLHWAGVAYWTYFYNYLSPTVIVLSIVAFIGLVKLSDVIDRNHVFEKYLRVGYRPTIVKMSSVVFGVYFVHRLIIYALWLVFSDLRNDLNPVIVGAVTFAIVTPTSFALAYAYANVSRATYGMRSFLADKLYAVEARYRS